METMTFQDKVNLVCKFFEEAQDDTGKKIFLPYVYSEDWKSVLDKIFSDEMDMVIRDTQLKDDFRIIRDCLTNLDFLYAFFDKLDNINLFEIIDEKYLMNRHFGIPGEDSYTKDVYIPGNVKKLPSSFFQNCTKIESVTFKIPSEITILPRGLFLGCKNLKRLNISNRIEKIGVLAVDPGELLDMEIRVAKEIPGNSWSVQIAGSDDTVEYWRNHIIKGE